MKPSRDRYFTRIVDQEGKLESFEDLKKQYACQAKDFEGGFDQFLGDYLELSTDENGLFVLI